MQCKHLGTEKVLYVGKTSRQLELARHVVGLHDLIGPLAINVVLLVNLEPACTNASRLRGIINGSEQKVRNGTQVTGVIPLHLDGVALGGINRQDASGDLGAVNVAGHVVGLDVSDRAVGGWHTDADLIARSNIVHPKLVKVLVSRDCAKEGGSNDGLGEHFESWLGLV